MKFPICFLLLSTLVAAHRPGVIRVDEGETGAAEGSFFGDSGADAGSDFAAAGCECTCDCEPGTDLCSCDCTCEDSSKEKDVAKERALAEQRKLKAERRRMYERELQDGIASITTPPSPVPTFNTEEETPPPSDMPSDMPSDVPSDVPSAVPSQVPSMTPSAKTSLPPSSQPSARPSDQDSSEPSPSPSKMPSPSPSKMPSPSPSKMPSGMPSPSPSEASSLSPSEKPSSQPSPSPSVQPSETPTVTPSRSPTAVPTPGETTAVPTAGTQEEEDCIEREPTGMPTGSPTANTEEEETAVPTSATEDEDCVTFEPTPGPGGRKLEGKEEAIHIVQPGKRHRSLQSTQGSAFDFIVAGFPKCGTTTLLKAFAAHNETDMASSEKCSVASPGMPDMAVLRKLDQTLAELSSDSSVKRSFKCPTAIYNHKTISRMEKHSPTAKFVIGVRHPVLMLQSFYNYRVTEIYMRNMDEEIPPLSDVLTAVEPWKGVSMASTRFELFLMQFGKTDLTQDDMQCFVGHPGYQLAIRPSRFQIFLYSTDQLEDTDQDRAALFRQGLQEYLGLKAPIAPFTHENVNHQVGEEGYAETINICDRQWRDVRLSLIDQGRMSAEWIRDKFIESPDVTVINKEHFIETLESWSVDPCEL